MQSFPEGTEGKPVEKDWEFGQLTKGQFSKKAVSGLRKGDLLKWQYKQEIIKSPNWFFEDVWMGLTLELLSLSLARKGRETPEAVISGLLAWASNNEVILTLGLNVLFLLLRHCSHLGPIKHQLTSIESNKNSFDHLSSKWLTEFLKRWLKLVVESFLSVLRIGGGLWWMLKDEVI